MNKRIKSIIATVTVLVLGAFSLSAEEVKAFDQCSGTYKTYTSEMKKTAKVNESKLSSLRYVKKVYKITNTRETEDFTFHYSSDKNVIFLKSKSHAFEGEFKKGTFFKMCVVNVDNEVYGRVVFHASGLYTLTCNLHDTEYSFKSKLVAYVSEEDIEDLVKTMKGLAIELATNFKKECN